MTHTMRPVGEIQTPRYLLRRKTILTALKPLPRGSFLEVGCGRGELLPWLGELGFTGLGLEISSEVLPMAHAAAEPLLGIQVAESLEEVGEQQFDYLMSFEVLEHIEDDRGFLQQWVDRLAPDGLLVCTVPAHMKLWSSSDEAVGHVRRYERSDLLDLLDHVGLEPTMIWSYGYPLVLFTGPLRSLYHRLRERKWRDRPKMDRTLASSTDSTVQVAGVAGAALRLLVGAGARVFYYLGLPLRKTDRGDGYLVVARRKS